MPDQGLLVLHNPTGEEASEEASVITSSKATGT